MQNQRIKVLCLRSCAIEVEAHDLLHEDISEAAGRNDVHHSVSDVGSDVYITSINHWVEKQHNRTSVLENGLSFEEIQLGPARCNDKN